MSEVLTISLTAALTVLGGLFVLVVGRLTEKFLIEPIIRFRSTVREVAYALDFYANAYCNPSTLMTEDLQLASRELRHLAGQLRANSYELTTRPWIRLRAKLPTTQDIDEASSNMIGLSNGLFAVHPDSIHDLIDANLKRVDAVRLKLSIRT
ncbi:MAG: hypothetical protein KOO62_07040 [candidate division Zixibacteria bacterium]|nr:hypothetical protein [candidate division Zixibacteria bacterium]